MAVIDLLTERAPRSRLDRIEASVGDCDPYGIDVQLSLYVCYELHYRGSPASIRGGNGTPGCCTCVPASKTRSSTAVAAPSASIDYRCRRARWTGCRSHPATTPGRPPSCADEGSWEQMREYFVHRSLYHLKEGDPHAWAIPRLTGHAKAAFVAVEFDEFGGGRGDRVHQQLFADLMVAAGLDPATSHTSTPCRQRRWRWST